MRRLPLGSALNGNGVAKDERAVTTPLVYKCLRPSVHAEALALHVQLLVWREHYCQQTGEIKNDNIRNYHGANYERSPVIRMGYCGNRLHAQNIPRSLLHGGDDIKLERMARDSLIELSDRLEGGRTRSFVMQVRAYKTRSLLRLA